MSERACLLCAVYRRDAAPRPYERPQVDEACRHRLDNQINDVRNLFLRLANPEPAPVDDRRYARLDKGRPTGEYRLADPTAAVGGMAPTRGRSNQPNVSGSKEPGLPIDITTVDLLAPARIGSVRDTLVPATEPEPATVTGRRVVVGPDGPEIEQVEYQILAKRPVLDESGQQKMVPTGDQTGPISVATVLDEIVRDWRDALFPHEHLPVPTVPTLTAWLLNRSTTACDRHPAIADHAAEIRQIRGALYRALGEGEPLPQVMWGVLCRTDGCNDVSQLVKRPESAYHVECDACGRLYTEQEYHEWTKHLANQIRPKGRRSAGGLPAWATATAEALQAPAGAADRRAPTPASQPDQG
ncbi:hypothetical protein KBX50_05115 [Micromonospora sp. C51]|uniref:hypothetical protein n=1 Tax=Micromonospora sp. C51 TaxID=2824879 RepID=UPI001B36F220|nr:hypothetical protein [Micromonospora sp. C51]MBQ1047838.1 hypothetical protein [Micromonospora sp. C51]